MGDWRSRLLAAEAASRTQFWSHVDFLGDCWEWTATRSAWGYGRLRYAGHDFTAHRCSWEYFNGQLPADLWILHRCDNPPCLNPSHLFLGTPKDNTADMHAKGRAPRIGAVGLTNSHAVLNDSAVLEIRNVFAAGAASPKELAAQFGVTNSAINCILRGQTWSHVGGPISTEDRRGKSRRKAS